MSNIWQKLIFIFLCLISPFIFTSDNRTQIYRNMQSRMYRLDDHLNDIIMKDNKSIEDYIQIMNTTTVLTEEFSAVLSRDTFTRYQQMKNMSERYVQSYKRRTTK